MKDFPKSGRITPKLFFSSMKTTQMSTPNHKTILLRIFGNYVIRKHLHFPSSTILVICDTERNAEELSNIGQRGSAKGRKWRKMRLWDSEKFMSERMCGIEQEGYRDNSRECSLENFEKF